MKTSGIPAALRTNVRITVGFNLFKVVGRPETARTSGREVDVRPPLFRGVHGLLAARARLQKEWWLRAGGCARGLALADALAALPALPVQFARPGVDGLRFELVVAQQPFQIPHVVSSFETYCSCSFRLRVTNVQPETEILEMRSILFRRSPAPVPPRVVRPVSGRDAPSGRRRPGGPTGGPRTPGPPSRSPATGTARFRPA